MVASATKGTKRGRLLRRPVDVATTIGSISPRVSADASNCDSPRGSPPGLNVFLHATLALVHNTRRTCAQPVWRTWAQPVYAPTVELIVADNRAPSPDALASSLAIQRVGDECGMIRVRQDGAVLRAATLRLVKRIGLLGGMTWESSAEYYRLINEFVRDELGGLHSADCVLRSVDFAPIEELQRTGAWEAAAERLADEASALAAAGAELLVLCTNTMHKVADAITEVIDIPFVHIADATADAVRAHGLSRLGLLATAYTMQQDFYVGRLRDRHGLDVLVPDEPDRRIVHDVIYTELCLGVVNGRSRDEYRRIMRRLAQQGAEGILLGCTEIDLLVGPDDSPVQMFDTTRLHAQRAVEVALGAEWRSQT
jgi:aspartate racemase